jgi:hypothetical protein
MSLKSFGIALDFFPHWHENPRCSKNRDKIQALHTVVFIVI